VYSFPFPHREYHFHLSCIACSHFDVVFPSEESKSRVDRSRGGFGSVRVMGILVVCLCERDGRWEMHRSPHLH
jgi:hypothetical protein